jgi:hypothetical protein
MLIGVIFRGKVLGRMNFIFSKAFDNWTPAGPVLVSSKVVGELPELDLKTWWNGKLVQENNSKNMIFNVAEILSAMSVGKCNFIPAGFPRLTFDRYYRATWHGGLLWYLRRRSLVC